MNSVTTIFLVGLVILGAIGEVWSQERKDYKVGEPQYSLVGGGGGNNKKNWQAGFQAGLGTKVWESKDKQRSLELGATYGRGFVRHEGRTYKSEPKYGFGGTFRFGKK